MDKQYRTWRDWVSDGWYPRELGKVACSVDRMDFHDEHRHAHENHGDRVAPLSPAWVWFFIWCAGVAVVATVVRVTPLGAWTRGLGRGWSTLIYGTFGWSWTKICRPWQRRLRRWARGDRPPHIRGPFHR